MKKSEKLFYLNALLLVLTLVVSNIIVQWSFNFLGYSILLSVFTYPFVFFFANNITKNNDWKRTVMAIILAVIVQLLVFMGMSSINPESVSVPVVIGSLAGFALSQLVNLLFYENLAKPKRGKKIKFFELAFVYLVAILVDALVFAFILNNGIFAVDTFNSIMISIFIKVLVGALLVIFDKNVKKSK